MTSRKILICGGAGFMGSHLTDRLIAQGHHVEVVDDLSTGSLMNLALARNATGRFKFQNVAIESPEFAELVSLRQPEIIINLVGFTPALAHLAGAMASFRASVAVLEAARLAGVSKVVTTVPAALLYGEVSAKDLPIKEGHINDPRSSEEVIARAVTEIHGVYRERHGIEFTILATANVYGIRQRIQDGVVAAFVDAIENARAPIVHGTGKQSRDFIHIDDTVDAIVRSMDRAGGLVVNIGSGVSVTVSDLWALMGGKSALAPRTSTARPHDLSRLSLSPVRARIQLGWAPFTSLEEGLATLRSDS